MIHKSKNKVEYNFSDFTRNHYKKILNKALKTHQFSHYTDFNSSKLFLLNRHDVDFSVKNALALAEIENELNVSSTYFFMLHSEYYSFLEKNTITEISKIMELGHKIGLHFDAQFYNITSERELELKIKFEKEILEYFTGAEVDVFSFHNTTDFTMSCKEWEYGGVINTYANFFQEEVAYCSDSNGYWRFARMIDFIEENKGQPMQLLTHPVWWTKDIESPKRKINACIERRAIENKREYENTLKTFNRNNIDW